MTFSDFWTLFPRKVAKKDAERAWSKLTEAQQEKAVQAIPAHIRCWRRECRQMHLIPHAATWIHGERFDDEISTGLIAEPKLCCQCKTDLASSGYTHTSSGDMCSRCWSNRGEVPRLRVAP